MTMPIRDGVEALTEKEKQTLRLIVRGHDAKSTARNLGLSVHTINERLRDARRKLAVSSSRQAARLLLDAEGDGAASPSPQLFGDTGIGEDAARAQPDQDSAPIDGVGRTDRPARIIIGGFLMTLVLGLAALLALPQDTTAPRPTAAPASATATSVVDAARQWLTLVDRGAWDASYRATGPAFRKLNTLQTWASVSEKVRMPLGAVVSRTLTSQEEIPAPPFGYQMVKFRTTFANKADAVETVTLEHQDGVWHVVGVMIG